MPSIKLQAKLVAAAASSDKVYPSEHAYAQLEVTSTGSLKRKDPPVTPTKKQHATRKGKKSSRAAWRPKPGPGQGSREAN